jgi:hypothetical protein
MVFGNSTRAARTRRFSEMQSSAGNRRKAQSTHWGKRKLNRDMKAEGPIMSGIDGDEILERAEVEGESNVAVNKTTWAQVGRVTAAGRYMFKFGWLTITADDLAIWEKYPTAAFTLYSTSAAPPTKTEDKTDEEAGEEFRMGTFELSDSNYSESEK